MFGLPQISMMMALGLFVFGLRTVPYQQLQRQVNHPADVRGLNVPEDKFYANLDHIVEAAEADGTMFNNPRVPDTQEVRRLFEYAYAGHDVDF